MVLLQVSFTFSPAVNKLFGSASLGYIEWVWILSGGLSVYLVIGAENWLRRRANGDQTMTPRTLWLSGIILSIIPLQHVQAVEPLTAQELVLHCKAFPDQADSIDGQYCVRYIQSAQFAHAVQVTVPQYMQSSAWETRYR